MALVNGKSSGNFVLKTVSVSTGSLTRKKMSGSWTGLEHEKSNKGGGDKISQEKLLWVELRVGNSLIRSSLFRSKSLILNSNCEQFALIAL